MSTNDGTSKIRVLVVDDHELFRQGVSGILERTPDIEVVGEAANGELALEQCRSTLPDVIVMDINMPVCDGLEATRKIKHEYPYVKILILTASDAESMLFESVKSGASGYILKNSSPAIVIDGVRRVAMGEPVIPSSLALQIISEFSNPVAKSTSVPLVDALTEREAEVLRHLSTGATNKEIAASLYISENTVRNHVRNILDKLHLSNRVQAAAFALKKGYIMPED